MDFRKAGDDRIIYDNYWTNRFPFNVLNRATILERAIENTKNRSIRKYNLNVAMQFNYFANIEFNQRI